MFRSYLKLGFRNLRKHRLSSIINIGGLALAVGCCLMVFEYVNWSVHLDSFHSKINNLFVIEKIADKNGTQQLYGNAPAPLGPMLKDDLPQIRNIARLNYKDVVIKQGDNVFRENVTFVDDAFYNMFDFPIKWGDKQHFIDPDGIVLTYELSEKLFGGNNSVGKIVSIRFNNDGHGNMENFTVKGVLDKQPIETSFYFSALVPFQKMASLGMDKVGDWKQSADITFVEADNETALSSISSHEKKYVDLYNAVNTDDKISALHFQPLKTMNFHAYKVTRQYFNAMKPAGVIMLLVIAIAILLLVYFNYMNIIIASAANRLKEISVRKVMGSNRKQIVFQFITENLMLCIIAVIIGLFLAKAVFIPWFSSMANVQLGQALFVSYRTWVALFVLVIVSALSGAAYPSFYISSFNPVSIMKGNKKIGSKNHFRKALLGFQFFLTFLSISTAIAFLQETKHIKTKPWGYNPENNVVVTLDKSADYSVFEAALKEHSKIRSVAGSVQPLGSFTKEVLVHVDGKPETVKSIGVLPGFASQLGIKIIKGRDLSKDFKTDQTASVLVNQAFLKQMGWSTGIGKSISYENHTYLVVGEVNNFHYEDFEYNVGPIVIMGCKPEDVNFVYVKTESSLLSNAHAEVKDIWQKVNPDLPFDYHYQDAVFDHYFNGFSQVAQVLSASSLIMTIISISGIFALALIILGKKMKEISVRKVLGAGFVNITYLITKEFLFALGFAILFGLPLSFWLTGIMFNQLSSDSQVSVLPLVFSFIAIIFITVVSVSWHIFKAYTANPTQYLKDE